MAKLKGVIFGVENVLMPKGELSPHAGTLHEICRLVQFLRCKDVESVVMTNKPWVLRDTQTNKTTPLQDAIESRWGVRLNWYQCAKDGVPAKQSAESISYVREDMGWAENETLFIGNSEVDMQAAVNGKILLLNAEWYEKNMEYGFGFQNPKEVARFIDTFCFRDHLWYFKIEEPPLYVYSLAPLGSFYVETKYYSEDFLRNVKNEFGQDQDFWAKFLCTSMYFSGIYKDVNYITSYPKHAAGEYPEVLVKAMDTFAKCFRARYLRDLVVRHSTAIKSQFHRSTVDHANQLNTICLNPRPHRLVQDKPKQYASFPIKRGSTVLVIDDVCTKGMSFEAARSYLTEAGAEVICVSFLKALSHNYEALGSVPFPKGVFAKNSGCSPQIRKIYDWRVHVVDSEAPTELTERLKKYQSWDWPNGL